MSLLKKFALTPRKLFLIDGLGASLTALLLSQVVARFESAFGMPRQVVYGLAGLAAVFAVYSITCHLRLKNRWRPYLRGIATANLLYCALSLGCCIYFRETLTVLGWAYFTGEILIVLALVRVEWAMLSKAGADSLLTG